MADTEWNDERIAMLRRLWMDGLSTSLIAERMGISKNAVVGKAHRLFLPSRPNPIRRAYQRKSKYLPYPLAKQPFAPRPQAASIIQIERRSYPEKVHVVVKAGEVSEKRKCQWPMWDNDTAWSERKTCDAPALMASRYHWCPAHDALGSIPNKKWEVSNG